MTTIQRLLITAAAMTLCHNSHAEEAVVPSGINPKAECEVQDMIDEAGWHIIATDSFTIHFPSAPKIDKRGDIKTYSSLDSGSFPVIMYTFTVNTPKTPVDAEKQVNDTLERLSTYPSNLLHHEIVESENELVMDTLCADAKTRVMRCDRMVITKDRVYNLMTLFFPNSAENHDYFVQHFTH